MKKFLSLVAIAAMATFGMTSCSNDEGETVNFYTVNFEESYFTALIDNPQYGGKLLYSPDEYKWQDKETTLSSKCEKEDWSQWGMEGFGWKNGIAISNYVDATADSFDKQLAVPSKSQVTGNNFAVVWDNNSELTFADGQAHTIVSMDICNTSYALANIKKNLGKGYEFKVNCTFYKADGSKVEDAFLLAKDDQVIDKWTTLNMSGFGPIKKIVFTFDGTDKGDWGLNTPKYFALDNIVVAVNK